MLFFSTRPAGTWAQIGRAPLQRLVVHPQQGGGEAAAHQQLPVPDQHAAPGDVDLPIQTEGDGIACAGRLVVRPGPEQSGHPRLLPAGQDHELVAHPDRAGANLPLEAPEGVVGAADPLHGHAEARLVPAGADLHSLQVVQQGLALVPGQAALVPGQVVPLCRRHRDDSQGLQLILRRQRPDLALDLPIDRRIIAHQIHLIYREHEVADAHQGADAGVPAGLHQHALGGVDENQGQLRKGGPHRHVAGVLLVPRRVGHDEAAPLGGEVAVGYVDGDALLPLRHQAVQQQGVVQLPVGAAHPGLHLQRPLLIGEEELGVVEHMADQGGLAVVHAAAGDEFQQALLAQKYPSRLRFSMLAWPPSRSITRVMRSLFTAPRVSSTISSSVEALDSTAPVSG